MVSSGLITWIIKNEARTSKSPIMAFLTLSLASPACAGIAPDISHCTPPHTSITNAASLAMPKLTWYHMYMAEKITLSKEEYLTLWDAYQKIHKILEKKVKTSSPLKSLRGIWPDTTITEEDIEQSKQSLFKYRV
jgi:hypothetical protein